MKLPNFQPKHDETRRYFPVVAILAAVATLILLLLIYSSRNIRLTRQRLEDSLLQEGVAVIRAIEAGNRAGMRMRWAMFQMQALVEEIGTAPKIAYISVIGTDDTILAHSQPEYAGQTAAIDATTASQQSSILHTRTLHEYEQHEGIDVFEITMRLPSPVFPENGHNYPGEYVQHQQTFTGAGMGRIMGMMHGMMGNAAGLSEIAIIQVGLKMTEFHHLQERDLQNTILMVLVLSVAGSAALYFIVVMQNYYAVNHAFQNMKSYTQHVIDSMANGLISLDNEGKVVTMNRQAYQILGLPPHANVQKVSLNEVLPLQQCDIFDTLARDHAVIDQEFLCTTVSRKTLPLSLSASTLRDDEGRHLGTVLLFKDLSDVKTLQEQIKRAERLASLGRLAAGVAHEIRNPLGALKGFLQYFQRKQELQEQDKTYLAVMVKEVDRLNAVISNLLDFARPQEPGLQPCRIDDLIRHVATLVASDLESKNLHLTLDIADALPLIPLDCDQITQVLLNILLNAIQATEPGGAIRMAANLNSESQRLELTISDTGKGIAPEELTKVFDPFFSTRKQGAGLGLAIAYTIIENHQGELTVTSEEGQGTAFQICFPL